MADETNILKILEDERKQREADKLNDAIRERIAALTVERVESFEAGIVERNTMSSAESVPLTLAALVNLLAPEGT